MGVKPVASTLDSKNLEYRKLSKGFTNIGIHIERWKNTEVVEKQYIQEM